MNPSGTLLWAELKGNQNKEQPSEFFSWYLSHDAVPACIVVLTVLKMMTCGSLHKGRRVTFLPVRDLQYLRIRSLLEAPKAAGGDAILGRNLTVYMARCSLSRMSVGQALICCLLL